jgi:hypothetical protein
VRDKFEWKFGKVLIIFVLNNTNHEFFGLFSGLGVYGASGNGYRAGTFKIVQN